MDKVRWTLIITDKSTGWSEDSIVFDTFTPQDDAGELIPVFDGKTLACVGVTEQGVEFRLVDKNGV